MKYHVTLRHRTCVIDVDGATVTIDGERLEAHWAAVPGTPLLSILLGTTSWTVACERLGPQQWALGAAGERLEAEVVEALRAQPRKAASGGVVKAPMPGLVVRVTVTVGQIVQAGAGLVVVEAMKMENELRANGPGVVQHVHVSAGDRVEKGAPLVTLGVAEPQS